MAKLEFDEGLVRRLSELLEETGLTEIEYEAEGRRIRVARTLAAAMMPAPAAAAYAGPAAHEEPAEASAERDAVSANAVAAPMVGTVYVAPEPGAPAFVSVGDQVAQGDTLAIIEAMKVMNPIPSPRAGKVTQILIQDGQPIEFGEPLMVIE